MEGPARLIHITGYIFEADFKQGVCQSYGRILYPNGNVYFGQHREFIREGLGKLITFTQGEIYEGSWENDKRFGLGRL